MRKLIRVVTVGCKANFADSAAVAAKAAALGFEIAAPGAPADVVVVNGCAVTQRAARDSRAAVRRCWRQNPGATLVLTGCYAEVSERERPALPEVDHWVPPRRGGALYALLSEIAGISGPAGPEPSEFGVDLALGHRRTFLKIQDGCDASCAYCVVPLARGPGRSAPEEEVLRRAAACEAEGAREIVLTGIHIGSYGRDRGEKGGLAHLVARLLDATKVARIRLSSIEPLEIDDAILSLLAERDRLCPHLHVPLQSGSDRVLARMRRPYRASSYAQAVERAAARVSGIQIGADLIAGFPGETRADFAETAAFLAQLPVHYLHVFPYSPRDGTESARWTDDVPPGEKKERVRALRELDRRKRVDFCRRQAGKRLTVLAETYEASTGELQGYSENYLSVVFPGTEEELGTLHEVEAGALRRDGRLSGTRAGRD